MEMSILPLRLSFIFISSVHRIYICYIKVHAISFQFIKKFITTNTLTPSLEHSTLRFFPCCACYKLICVHVILLYIYIFSQLIRGLQDLSGMTVNLFLVDFERWPRWQAGAAGYEDYKQVSSSQPLTRPDSLVLASCTKWFNCYGCHTWLVPVTSGIDQQKAPSKACWDSGTHHGGTCIAEYLDISWSASARTIYVTCCIAQAHKKPNISRLHGPRYCYCMSACIDQLGK